MANIECFSTAGLKPRQRRYFWDEVTSRVFTPLESKPVSPNDFNARLQRFSLGSLSLSRAISSPAAVIHSSSSARQSPEHVFLLHLQANGSSVNRQDGREALLTAGDFTLCDSTRPYSVAFDALNDMLVLRIAAKELRDRIVQPERFTARTVSGSGGVGGLVSQLVRQLWTELEGGLESSVADRLRANFLDLLVTALCAQQPELVQQSAKTGNHRLRMRHFVEEHLLDSELDANAIAAAVNLSPRYVHRLFEVEGETLGHYILRRRLEESARRLRDPAQVARSVMEIAFDCGFTDASYFCRSFRRRFGATPREYRHSS
jgi:AraC-like DNA-binding protein